MPIREQPARSSEDETASRRARIGFPDSRAAGPSQPPRARIDQQLATRASDDGDGQAREAPQLGTTVPSGARGEPTDPVTRAVATARTPPGPNPSAERSESFYADAPVEVSSREQANALHRPGRPGPMPEPVAAPRVHIGRIEVIVVAPSPPSTSPPPSPRGLADLASRRYLRNA